MLVAAFYDLKYFLAFFMIFIGTFAVFIYILTDGTISESYTGAGPFSFFIMAFRSSIGDNEMDDYLSNSDNFGLAWVMWLFIMIVGNMIFMNFIIAVVNESYENCMSKMTAQKFKVKVDMIIERESILTQKKI